MKRVSVILPVIFTILFLGGCSGCSKSGKRSTSSNPTSYSQKKGGGHLTRNGKTVLKMEEQNGVRYVWIEINGLRLRFIFDTGASNISISSAEASVLFRQGTLRDEDFLDVQQFRDATGRVSEGTIINLRTVKVGDWVLHNIEAVVIDNEEAPLLLGQSALSVFGKISIDYSNNEITLE